MSNLVPQARAPQLLVALALVLAAPAAFAQGTEEQQQACAPDAVKLCSDTIPDIPKTTACMKAHYAQLTPRCQAAFNDAVGSPKTKAAESRPAPRRAERRTREATRETTRVERHEREAAAPARPRPEREAALPPRRDDGYPPEADIVPGIAQTPGYPPFPAPDAPLVEAAPAGTPRSQIAQACRAGLIDAFTCQTTVPALLGR